MYIYTFAIVADILLRSIIHLCDVFLLGLQCLLVAQVHVLRQCLGIQALRQPERSNASNGCRVVGANKNLLQCNLQSPRICVESLISFHNVDLIPLL